MSFLYILDINPLLDVWLVNIFYHSIYCLFILLFSIMFSLLLQKLFSLKYSHLFIFAFVYFGFCVISKKALPRPMSGRIFSMFSLRNFMVSGLTCKSLVHFELIIFYGVRQGSNFIPSQTAIHIFLHYLLRRLSFSPLCVLDIFVKD